MEDWQLPILQISPINDIDIVQEKGKRANLVFLSLQLLLEWGRT